jgi:hypothetical protein
VIDQFVAAYRDLEGTTYVHCHHGKHRGGAAVAVFRMTFEGFSSDEAIAEMFELGCSPRYKGLYETIATYRPDPAVAHRAHKAKEGLAGHDRNRPRLFRAIGEVSDASLKSAKELGMTRVVLVNGGRGGRREGARRRSRRHPRRRAGHVRRRRHARGEVGPRRHGSRKGPRARARSRVRLGGDRGLAPASARSGRATR